MKGDPDFDGERDTRPGEEEVCLNAEGHRRYAVAKFRVGGKTITLKERIGLHVFDMKEEDQEFHMQKAADKLRRRVLRRIREG